MKTTHYLTMGDIPQQATGKMNAHRNVQPKLPIPTRNNLFMLFAWIGLLMGVLLPHEVSASHILGSDITYTCLGNGCSYQINHTMYLDCGTASGGQLSYSPYASITPTGVGGPAPAMPPASSWIQQSAWQDVTPVCNTTQTNCQSGSLNGVMAATFTTTYNLCGSTCSAVNLQWLSGARSQNITSGAANMDISISGITIPLSGITPCNSTPQFSNPPIAYICLGQTNYYSQGATDPDGDVLTYSLGNCMISPTQPVNYNSSSGFSGTSPLGSNWNVAINPTTGVITFNPISGGAIVNAVLCVYITESRNGVVINQIERDMNVLVINCPNATANVAPTTMPNTTSIQNGISGLTASAALATAGPASTTITACEGSVIAFYYQIRDVVPSTSTPSGQQVSLNWSWAGGGGLPSISPLSGPAIAMNAVHSYTANSFNTPYTLGFNWPAANVLPGTYFLNFHLEDDACPIIGQNDYTIEFIIKPKPTFPLAINYVCQSNAIAGVNLATTLGATPAGGTYTCTTPGGTITNGTFTATATGSYNITYTSTNGCSKNTQLVVTANPVLNNATSSCYIFVSGSSNTLNLFTTFGVSASGQFLQNGVAVSGNAFPLNANPSNAQQIYNGLSYVLNNCTSAVAILTVRPFPVFTNAATFTTCLSTAQTGINLASASGLPANPTGGSYTVSSASAQIVGGVFTASAAGTYTITYNVNGCSKTKTITVYATPTIPNNTICHNFTASPTSVNLTTTLVPTPSGGQFYLNGTALSGNVLPLNPNPSNVPQTYSGITYIANGCTSAVTTVTLNPVPIVTPSSVSRCVDATTAGINLSTIYTTTTPSGGTFTCASANISINAGVLTTSIPGTYTLTYTINGCSKNVTFIVKALPVITNPSVSLCYAGPTTVNLFSNLNPNPTGGTFALNGNTINGTAFSVSPGITYSPITYTQGGCTSLPASLTVNFIPVISPSSFAACLSNALAGINLGSIFTITPAAATGGTYTCSAPGAVVNGVFSASVPGTYTLTYTKNNCTATTTLVITQPPVITPINSSYCYVANSNAAINLTSLYTSTPASGTFSVANASGATVYTGTGTSFIPPQLGTFGNYTVTYTAGTPPCPATVNLTINQLPVLTNPTISACQANAINLGTLIQPQPTGGTFGPASSIVTNASGSFLQVPTSAGANFPITYTYTNPNGQTCTAGGSVYVSPVVTITGNNNLTLCSPGANTPIDLNTLIQPVTTPATSGGYFTGPGITGSSIFTPTGIGSYQVTYVVIDAIGCEFREVFTFQINDCCYYGSATQYIPMGNNGQTTTLSSLIGTGALPPSPATVQRTFSGKLLVDVPYVFSGSHIILCPGAEIEVNPNIKVTLNNSTILEGNTAMWKGIKNFGALTIKGATIRDAEFAVNEQIGGTTSITNSLFDRNFIGILGNPNAIFGQFWGNTFDCVGCSGTSATTMLAAYNGQSNWATFSRAGIQLNNSNITIGTLGTGIPLGTLNYFRNSKYGIESYNSQATVLNSNITHANWIAAPSSIVSPPAAAGIYGYNSSISVTGMGTTPSDPNAFHHCHYGIFAANGQYTCVQDCKMEYTNTLYPMRIGIHTQNTPLTNISIDRNLIHATDIGINSLYDENVSHLRINSNTINMNQASATQLANAGIQITELGATGKCVIYQNTINLNQCYTGVRLNTTSRTIVNKNIININSNIISIL